MDYLRTFYIAIAFCAVYFVALSIGNIIYNGIKLCTDKRTRLEEYEAIRKRLSDKQLELNEANYNLKCEKEHSAQLESELKKKVTSEGWSMNCRINDLEDQIKKQNATIKNLNKQIERKSNA